MLLGLFNIINLKTGRNSKLESFTYSNFNLNFEKIDRNIIYTLDKSKNNLFYYSHITVTYFLVIFNSFSYYLKFFIINLDIIIELYF